MGNTKPRHNAYTTRLLRLAARARGLCAEVPCEVLTGERYRCPAHAAEYRDRLRRFRARKAQEKRIAAR